MTVTIRCYCHGLGDCMLLSLPRADPAATPFRILIDCGIHTAVKGGPDMMRLVAADLAEASGGVIDVIVGTHEHWDHLSAFFQAADIFQSLTIREVWLSWAENPGDAQARKLDRFKTDSMAALTAASAAMTGTAMAPIGEGIDGVLSFVLGLKGENVRRAREALSALCPTVRYLEPGTLAPLPVELGICAYVLAPTRDEVLLGLEDRLDETYAFGGTLAVAPLRNALALADGTLDLDDDPAAPFDGKIGMPLSDLLAEKWPDNAGDAHFFWTYYLSPVEEVVEKDTPPLPQQDRRIDHDWLAGSIDLALQFDGRVNNSSLVLAFEIAATQEVLLFAADAQVGSWKSWPATTFPAKPGEKAVTGEDLLRRTVFYKVGHHGSRNATLRDGLEIMDHRRLVAFNPTDEARARSVKWSDFPAPRLTARLREATSGRYFAADAPWLQNPGLPEEVARGGALHDYRRPKADWPGPPYVELDIGSPRATAAASPPPPKGRQKRQLAGARAKPV